MTRSEIFLRVHFAATSEICTGFSAGTVGWVGFVFFTKTFIGEVGLWRAASRASPGAPTLGKRSSRKSCLSVHHHLLALGNEGQVSP